MGMSNEQFDSYKQRELRLLEKVKQELDAQNAKSETLEAIIGDLRSELKKP